MSPFYFSRCSFVCLFEIPRSSAPRSDGSIIQSQFSRVKNSAPRARNEIELLRSRLPTKNSAREAIEEAIEEAIKEEVIDERQGCNR